MLRSVVFDLETSNLEGDVGRILCASFSDGEKVWSIRADKIRKKGGMANDGEISRRIRDTLEKYDVVIGWHIKGFDLPFLRTRLAANGERVLRAIFTIDGRWYMAGWRGLKPRNARLSTAAEFFNIKGRKMNVDVSVWIDAALGGDSAAMDILVDRCESDVKLTEQVTRKIISTGLMKQIVMY